MIRYGPQPTFHVSSFFNEGRVCGLNLLLMRTEDDGLEMRRGNESLDSILEGLCNGFSG